MPSLESGLLEDVETAISAHLSATSVLEHLPVGAYVCAPDGRIIRYNMAAADLWGRTPIPGADEHEASRRMKSEFFTQVGQPIPKSRNGCTRG